MKIHAGLLLAVCVSIGAAQDVSSPAWQRFRQETKAGDRIRIETEARFITGRVAQVTAEGVSLRRRGNRTQDFTVKDVLRIRRIGNRAGKSAKSAAIGAAIGSGAGAALGAIVANNSGYQGAFAGAGAAGGAMIGAIIGSVLGASTAERTLVYQRP